MHAYIVMSEFPRPETIMVNIYFRWIFQLLYPLQIERRQSDHINGSLFIVSRCSKINIFKETNILILTKGIPMSLKGLHSIPLKLVYLCVADICRCLLSYLNCIQVELCSHFTYLTPTILWNSSSMERIM